MLRVLSIIPSGSVYGLQHMTLNLFKSVSRNVDSHFLITRWTDGEFASKLDEISIPYTYSWLGMFSRKLDWVNLKMTTHCALKIPSLYRDLLNLVRTYNPTIIYTANYHELILLCPLLPLAGKPVICHMHDPPSTTSFYRSLFSILSRAIDRYIAVSRNVQLRLERLGVKTDKISLLDNGIDLSEFPYVASRSDFFAKRYGWPSDSVIIGMTGQMIQEKGHLDLIEAVRIVRSECPSVHLVIGGKKDGIYYEQLKSTVRENGLEEVVAFSGWQAEVRDFFSEIDIFILASHHEEGFGLVVAQAMATGLPVVATRRGGVTEVVEDGKTGVLVEKSNVSQLTQAIQYLVKSPMTRKAMGKAGRGRVETYFDLSKQALRFEAILKDASNPHRI